MGVVSDGRVQKLYIGIGGEHMSASGPTGNHPRRRSLGAPQPPPLQDKRGYSQKWLLKGKRYAGLYAESAKRVWEEGLSTPKDPVIIYTLPVYLYDAVPRVPRQPKCCFRIPGQGGRRGGTPLQRFELIWWHFPLAFSNHFRRYRSCVDLVIPHFPEPVYD